MKNRILLLIGITLTTLIGIDIFSHEKLSEKEVIANRIIKYAAKKISSTLELK